MLLQVPFSWLSALDWLLQGARKSMLVGEVEALAVACRILPVEVLPMLWLFH